MDPSIMKLLEEDEDETMHSGADVEAFTAALNRDIEGDVSTSQPSDSDSGALSQGSNHNSSQMFPQWQTSSQDENSHSQSQQDLKVSQQQEQHSTEMELKQHVFGTQSQQQKQSQDDFQQRQAKENTLHFSQTMGVGEHDRMQVPNSESQHPKLQSSIQHPMSKEQAMNPMGRGKQVPFAALLPVIQPQLDKDRAMQLHNLYLKLKKNEISKDGFVRHMRSLVGDQMLKMAVYKLQAQQAGPNQFPGQSQASAQQHNLKMPSTAQMKPDSSNSTMDSNAQRSDSHGMQASQMSTSSLSIVNQERERPTIPIQGLSKQQQQHLHFSQPSFPMYGGTGGNYHPFSGTNVSTSAASLKQQPHDSQMRQVPVPQSQSMNAMSVPKFERQTSFGEPKRVHGGNFSNLPDSSTLQQNSVHWQPSSCKEQKNGAPSPMNFVKQEQVDQGNEQQNKSQFSTPQGLSSFSPVTAEYVTAISGTSKDDAFEMQSSRMVPSNSVSSSMPTQLDPNNSLSSRNPSSTSPVGPGNNVKTPQRKPSIGQKKPLDALGSSPPMSSKKQKVSGGFLDQSIEQLNDVTAVSGVNLREEEEQLFSGPKEDSRVSEASRRVVQEEEEKLILQKLPLQKKLAEIMVKCGLKSVSNDVERCLSLCVEERMRGLVSNLIRLSKQRVDIEKPRHRTVVTSDVRQQIMAMNQKAREEWEKKQAEAAQLNRLNEPEGNTGVDGDKDKDDGRSKSLKVNKEEDDKMRTTAANVAARAAVGGDDMLSKWQLMAEQARQKREGVNDAPSGSQPGKDVSRKPLSTSGRNTKDNQEVEKRGHQADPATSGHSRQFGRNQVILQQTRVPHSISVKDVISALEREPQMSKSTMIYRLYEKSRAAVAE